MPATRLSEAAQYLSLLDVSRASLEAAANRLDDRRCLATGSSELGYIVAETVRAEVRAVVRYDLDVIRERGLSDEETLDALRRMLLTRLLSFSGQSSDPIQAAIQLVSRDAFAALATMLGCGQ